MRQKGFAAPIISITIIAFAVVLAAYYFGKLPISKTLQPTPATQNETPIPVPAGFSFIIRYGAGQGDVLDTSEGTYTKDMVMDPSITIKMLLSDEEKSKIYQKILEINFFDYPNMIEVPHPSSTDKNSISSRLCDPQYELKVVANAKVKKVNWDGCVPVGGIPKGGQVDRFEKLIRYIQTIIESKTEYKKLPAPRGGYL